MAWSDAARRAALEARRRKRKLPQSDYSVVTAKDYASELRYQRSRARLRGMKPGKKRNQYVRRQAKFIMSI